MPHEILVEACVDSVDSAVAAETGGAHRIELCAALREGGLTPSAGTIAVTRQRTTIDIQVMIRPRGGDFLYSDTEYASMQRDVEMAKRLGSNGVVFGLLTPDGEIDVRRTEQLTEQARPMAVTFHRAFDMAGNPTQSLEALVGLHIERVLTSGQRATAVDGIELLRKLVTQAGDRIVVMPGGNIDEQSLPKILGATGAREIHVTGTKKIESAMTFRNPHCYMGIEPDSSEFSRSITDTERIRTLVELAR